MGVPIALTSGAYTSESVIANAQRCINLYPEFNPAGSKDSSVGSTKPPMPVTHYQRPGKRLLGSPAVLDVGRGLYTASNGDLYAQVGPQTYYIDPTWRFFLLGLIDIRNTPVSFADNGEGAGNSIVLVDGTPNGYEIDITTRIMTLIVDPTGLFVGADVVSYLQTFFLFNWPSTPFWYVSLPNSVTFDALDIAAKASYPDPIATIGVHLREVWLIGTQTTEPWFLSGAADFAFEAVPSTFVPHGCLAKYSKVFADVSLFWLSRNSQGQAIIVKSEGYAAKRISTHAIEAELQKYADITDCIGNTYQINGHTFVAFHFPTANISWVYDLATAQWHQEAWTDENGNLNRDRAVFYANAYGKVVGQDWETGKLYQLDPTLYTDDGDPISFIRGFPHVINQLSRVTHWNLIADIQCGTIVDDDENDPPMLNMRYSDTRGNSWEDWIQAPLGLTGAYDTIPQFARLGMARDRVYELMWSVDAQAPLNGVYIEVEEHES